MAVRQRTNPLRDPRDRRLPRIAGPCCMVIFGVTGDLSRKKVMPALYDLHSRGLLPPSFSLVGFARRAWGHEDFAAEVHDAVREHARTEFREEVWEQMCAGIRFVAGDIDDDAAFDDLAAVVSDLDRERGTGGNRAFYFAIPPKFFGPTVQQLQRSGLATPDEGSWSRVVIEKPFGHDLESARELNALVESVFDSESVFRIDHYLGKETVQNLLAIRFANNLFEPIWDNRYVDHVQITMAEDIGIGSRAGYYDGIGSARDVIQNHLMQLMCLVAMEDPNTFEANNVRREKERILNAVRLPKDLQRHTAYGQYAGGFQGGVPVVGYLEEEGIPADSVTDTFAAVRLDVQTRRWAGVPFYLRTGKRLGRRVTEIAVAFKATPHSPFPPGAIEELTANVVVFRIQPDEGVTVRFGSKIPGTQMEVRDVTMDFQYGDSFTVDSPEAYERLIIDVLLGDPPLFPRQREVERSWEILDPILRNWRRGTPESYPAGSWGPPSAHRMMEIDGRAWRRP
jgi:glucose-6-phosphate 1-dehydrogenase